MKVLCADDDADIRVVLEFAFAQNPAVDAEIVASGEEVLERAHEAHYDVIVLDGWMPGLDGYETCERLKSDAATAATPVVFLTANSDRTQIERARSVGAAGTITKPFDPVTLVGELSALLNG